MPDYKVTVEGSEPIPVRAGNTAAARNFAVRAKVKVEPLTTDDAIAFGKKGVDIMDANEDPPAPGGGESGSGKPDGPGEDGGQAKE